MDAGTHFEFVEGATSDLSFVAQGPTLKAVFLAAGQAFLAATVEEPTAVERRVSRSVVLEEPDLELLLVRFLNELVYLRDVDELLLHPEDLDFSNKILPELAGHQQLLQILRYMNQFSLGIVQLFTS